MNPSYSPPFNHDEWSSFLPLPEGVPILDWPSNAFPEPFESFVNELARSTETPIELAAMITLSAVATVAQKKYEVQIKADYAEPVNIWTAAILPPASRKSRVYSEVTKPLREWELEQKTLTEPLINSAESKRKTIDARLKHLRGNAAKAKNESIFAQCQNEVEQLEKIIPEVPACPQIWTSDVTPEHLGTIMARNDEAMAVLSDEAGIFDILNGLYSNGNANIDLFLQSHSGSPVRVDRGSRPPIFMNRAVLSMGLCVQPQVIKTICGNRTFRGRGLLARFLYVMPNSNIGQRTYDEPPMSEDITRLYKEGIRNIINQSMSNSENNNGIHKLEIDDVAYKRWYEYAVLNERLMDPEIGRLSHMTDWAGKLPGAIARIAALLHIMRYSKTAPWEHSISFEDMDFAVKIGHCLVNHAQHVFEMIQLDSSIEIAKEILIWIKDSGLNRFTLRECERKFRRYKKTELQEGIDLLKDCEYLRWWSLKPEAGRPSNVFDVNPTFLEKGPPMGQTDFMSTPFVPIVPFVHGGIDDKSFP